jgi:hypothetical protein
VTATRRRRATLLEKIQPALTAAAECMLLVIGATSEHWDRLRTSNPIESVFATIRQRTVWTIGFLSLETARLTVFKLSPRPRKHGAVQPRFLVPAELCRILGEATQAALCAGVS